MINIIINNDKDKNKFYRLLWVYKYILYFTRFNYTGDDVFIKDIVGALNIRNRKDRITYIFDKACLELDNKNKGINICGFKDGKCILQQLNNSKYSGGCCKFCVYNTDKGCPSKNVACKLFNCSCVTKKYDCLEYKDLKILRLLSFRQRIVIQSNYFTLREDAIKDLLCYTFTYTIIRVVYRNIKNIFKKILSD